LGLALIASDYRILCMACYAAGVKHSLNMTNPVVHSVHFYDDSTALISRLCGIVASALQIGNAVLIVATKPHREDLIQAVSGAGVDVRKHARQFRFAMYDAEQTLGTFMRNNRPSPHLFRQSVGRLLKETRSNSRSKENGLTVFGEMVAVLWEQGRKKAALELEALWNEALNNKAFHLHCAYRRLSFPRDADDALLAQVCNAHSHITIQSPLNRQAA
jgi:hypothetical protein